MKGCQNTDSETQYKNKLNKKFEFCNKRMKFNTAHSDVIGREKKLFYISLDECSLNVFPKLWISTIFL